MTFWKNHTQPEKFCVTTGSTAFMITQKEDELKIIQRRLDAGYAANIKARYGPDKIENYPIIKDLVNLITARLWKNQKN